MKKILSFIVVTIMFSTILNATWVCQAFSKSSAGWGEAYSKRNAKIKAISNCLENTPKWDTCIVKKKDCKKTKKKEN